MRKKKSHRAIYGLLGTVVAVTAIGNVAAKEAKPYKAPELRLVQGTEDYDLTEGITYDKGKYELMVEDTRDFDIEVLGKYEVEYSLTPLDEDDERYSDSDNAGVSRNEDPDMDSAFGVDPKENSEKDNSEKDVSGETEDFKESKETERVKAEAKKEGFFARMLARLTGHVHAAELDETEADASEERETEARPIVIDLPETTEDDSNGNDEKETAETNEQEQPSGGNEEDADSDKMNSGTAESEADNPRNDKPEDDGKNDSKEDDSKKDASEEDGGKPEHPKSDTAVSTATTSDAEDGSLDENDGIIYFERIVRVVASDTGSNIEFDDPHLEIPASAELFGIQIDSGIALATDSNAKSDEAFSDQETEDTLDEGFWVNENGDDPDAEVSENSDGTTENGVEYTLYLKNQELLLEDAYFTSADGRKLKKVEIKVKDADELKSAVLVEENKTGVPVITGMEPGTYTIELSAIDPETSTEITCEREIEIVPDERVKFDAPVLYIGTQNTSYDLTAGMMATDENGQTVSPIYVLDEAELLAAREEVQVKATSSNAEEANDEPEEITTEIHLKQGTYHVTLGAKHPVTGEEFTVKREVKVVDGYYIYAPVLEVAEGSTDYDLLSGVELRNAGADDETVEAEFTVVDSSNLEVLEDQDVMGDEDAEENSEYAAVYANEFVDESTGEEDSGTEAKADTFENPPLKEGRYQITIEATDQATGKVYTTIRSVQVASARRYDARPSMIYGTVFSFAFYNSSGTEWASKADSLSDIQFNSNFSGSTPQGDSFSSVSLKTPPINNNKAVIIANDGCVYHASNSMQSSLIEAMNFADNPSSNWITQLRDKLSGNSAHNHSGKYWKRSDGKSAVIGGFKNKSGFKLGNKSAAVTITMLKDLENLDLLDSNGGLSRLFGYVQSYNSDSSLMIDGNSQSWTNAASGAAITMPNIQLGLKNIAFDYQDSTGSGNANPLQIKLGDASYADTFLYLENLSGESDNMGTRMIQVSGLGTLNGRIVGGANAGKSVYYQLEGMNELKVETDGTDMLTPMQVGAKKLIIQTGDNALVADRVDTSAGITYFEPGTLKFNNAADGAWTPADNLLETKDIGLLGSPRIEKSTKQDTTAGVALSMSGTFYSNGQKIQAAMNGAPLTAGALFAKSTVTGGLDATNFTLADLAQGTTNLYFSSRNNGTEIYVRELADGTDLIKVSGGGEAVQYYHTYADAINSLAGKNSGTYTISNTNEVDFTADDAAALKDFTNTKVKLVFESGDRGADNPDGKAGTRYRVRMKKQILHLPADVDITFRNIVMKYAQPDQETSVTYAHITDTYQLDDPKEIADSNDLMFIRNGGNLTFGSNVTFLAGDTEETGYTTVYGGGDDAEETDDVTILAQSGTFASIYGGSRGENGTHSGAATITINGTATVRDTISGGSESQEAKVKDNAAGGIAKQSVITIASDQNVKNIYDYDKLTMNSNSITVSENFNSEKAAGYDGETILGSGTSLILSGNGTDQVRQMGTLKLAEGATANASLKFAKTQGTSSDLSNTNLVVLTKADPLASTHTTLKIAVGYSDDTPLPEAGDIVFYLKGVPDDEAAKKAQVSAEHLEDQFVNANGEHVDSTGLGIAMIENPQEKTIAIVPKKIGLTISPDTKINHYFTLAETLKAIQEAEGKAPKGTYRINFFSDNYTFSEEDKQAMESMRTTTAEQITWTSKIHADGTDLAAAKTVFPNGDLTFFGSKTIVKDMTLSFPDQSAIYADGKPLEILTGVNVSAGSKPDLYGGGKTEAASTSLLIQSGEFNSIYGGGNGAAVTGSKVINIPVTNTVVNLCDFTELTVGDAGTTKATLTVTGKLDYDPGAAKGNIFVRTLKKAVDAVLDFVGIQNADEATQSGVLNLKNAELKFTGTESGHVGSILINDNTSGIYVNKKDNATLPLHIEGEVKTAENSVLILGISAGTPQLEDIILIFNDESKAIATQYKYQNTSFAILKRLQNIVIGSSGRMRYDGDYVSAYINKLSNVPTNTTALPYYAKYNPSSLKFDKTEVSWSGFIKRTHAGVKGENEDPDVRATVVSSSALVGRNELNFNDLSSRVSNMSESSSILIDGNQTLLNFWHNSEQLSMKPSAGMQIELKDFHVNSPGNGAAFRFNIGDNVYLKFNGLYATAGNGHGNYSSADYPKKEVWTPSNNGTIEIVGSKTSTNNPYYCVTANNLIIRATDQDMTTGIRIDQGSKNSLTIDTNEKLITLEGINGSKDGRHVNIATFGGGGILLYLNDTTYNAGNNIPKVLGTNDFALTKGGITVLMSQLTLNNSREVINLSGKFTSNGYKIAAGFNGKTYSALNGKTFMLSKGSSELDPTDFCVNENDRNNAYWKNDGNWYMLNGNGNDGNKKIIFKQLADFKPIHVIGGTLNNKYDSYADAIQAIQTDGQTTEYTIKNLMPVEFTEADRVKLKESQIMSGTTLIFTGGEQDTDHGVATYGTRYHVRMRNSELNVPAGVNVKFENITWKYDEGDQTAEHGGSNVTIIGNGGKLIFGENVQFIGAEKVTLNPVLYGGAIDAKTDGNSMAEIQINGDYTFTSIYNYDTLQILSGTTEVLETLNAQTDDKTSEAGGYAGITQIAKDAALTLSNGKLVKKIGSLKGLTDVSQLSENERANALGYLKIARSKIGAVSEAANPAVLNLTSEDPLRSTDDLNKIRVSYANTDDEEIPGDVVMYLPNVPEEKKADNVIMDYLESGFNLDGKSNIAMEPRPDSRTIILFDDVSVALKIGDGQYTRYKDVAAALTALKAHEEGTAGAAGNTEYTIAVFADDYTFDTEDRGMMKSMAALNPKQITWISNIGTPDDSGNATNRNNPASVILEEDMDFFGQSNILTDISLKAGQNRSLFANGHPLTVTSTAKVAAGTNAAVSVYGGSDDKAVTGDTSVTVEGRNFMNIHGGGRGNQGTVAGNAVITVKLPAEGTARTKTSYAFGTISGDGTAADGTLKESVTGTRNITIVPSDGNTSDYEAEIASLTGFTNLTLGRNADGTDYTRQIFRVTGRFDSKAADPAAETNDRTGTVTLNKSSLYLEDTRSGHIGDLAGEGETALAVKKVSNDQIYSLKLDGKVTLSSVNNDGKDPYNKMNLSVSPVSDAGITTEKGNVMIIHSDKTKLSDDNREKGYYADGDGNMLEVVRSDKADNTSEIRFDKPAAHLISAWIAYPADDSANAAVNLENAADTYVTNVNKYIHVDYDKDNEHRIKGGYIVRIPKDQVTSQDYTSVWVSPGAAYQGHYRTDRGHLTVATADGQDQIGDQKVEVWDMTFTATGEGKGATGRTDFTVPIDTENYFYVAHVYCIGQGGEDNGDTTDGEAFAAMVDVTGPKQKNTDVEVSFDADAQTYRVTGVFADPLEGDSTNRPDAPAQSYMNGKLDYSAHGVKEYAWAFGKESAVQTAADKSAKEKSMIEASAGGNYTPKAGLSGVAEATAAGAAEQQIQITLSKAEVDAAKERGETNFYLYLKDQVGNTSRYTVPITDHIIDVTVPTRVSLVALKKDSSSGSASDSRLLAPTCYVVNNGRNTIQVDVEQFEVANSNNGAVNKLKLVSQGEHDNYASDEIALFLKATDNPCASSDVNNTDDKTRFHLRNVLDIPKEENGTRYYAHLGDLKPRNDDGRTLDFTFGAYYNPKEIVETNDWITNIMSYRFAVVKAADSTQP